MKAFITPCALYDIEIDGGKLYKNCELESQWEGFRKFKTQNGQIIIVAKQPGVLGDFMDFIFDSENRTKVVFVVSASPDVWADVR